MGLRLLVILGSVREGRLGERVAKYVHTCLAESGHSVEIIDPLIVGTDGHLTQPLHFRKDQSTAPSWMTETNAKIVACQGLVIVTPEYNCSLPPALTSIMDQFPPASYKFKPASIICYSMGSFGGIRAAAIARPFLSELGMVSLPRVSVIPQVQNKFSEDGECTDDRSKESIDKLVKELTWYAESIATKLETDGRPDQ